MSVSDVLWEIESAIEDLPDHLEGSPEQIARSRRSAYEQTLVDVDQLAGTEAMHTLGNWIEQEIRATGRLPETHEVRQIGFEICQRTTSTNLSGLYR
jgi:hypothetical protein